jgi:prepilin-type N-terminal cleavage/methylation domain-containing protein
MIASPSRSDEGFTIVEVLIVLSVIGLMSGLMLAMMSQFRHLTEVDYRLTTHAALTKTVNHIAGLLERAEKLPLEIKPDAPLFFLKAGENSVRFLAVARSGALTSGFFEISISLEERNGIKRLIETISLRRMPQIAAETSTFGLFEPVERLRFSYLQKAEARGEVPVWRTDWQIAGQLPAAVRVTLDAKDRSGNLTRAAAIAYLAR